MRRFEISTATEMLIVTTFRSWSRFHFMCPEVRTPPCDNPRYECISLRYVHPGKLLLYIISCVRRLRKDTRGLDLSASLVRSHSLFMRLSANVLSSGHFASWQQTKTHGLMAKKSLVLSGKSAEALLGAQPRQQTRTESCNPMDRGGSSPSKITPPVVMQTSLLKVSQTFNLEVSPLYLSTSTRHLTLTVAPFAERDVVLSQLEDVSVDGAVISEGFRCSVVKILTPTAIKTIRRQTSLHFCFIVATLFFDSASSRTPRLDLQIATESTPNTKFCSVGQYTLQRLVIRTAIWGS